MRSKKRLTLITLLFTAISLMAVLLITPTTNSPIYISKLYDIFLGIFGSALLGCIMSLTEYFAVRKDAVETFIIETRKALDAFYDIKPLFINESIDLIEKCLAEEDFNKFAVNTGSGVLLKTVDHSAKKNYLKWCQENHYFSDLDLNFEKDLAPGAIDQVYEKKLQEYRNNIHTAGERYLKIANYDYNQLDWAYGQLDFLRGNKSIRSAIAYKQVYQPLKEKREKILRVSGRFAGENKARDNTILDTIVELDKLFFREERTNDDKYIQISIYRDFLDDVNLGINRLICVFNENADSADPGHHVFMATGVRIHH